MSIQETPVSNGKLDQAQTDPIERVISALDENFGRIVGRRAAHAKGLVAFGTFCATSEAKTISRAGHLQGDPVTVVVRFSNFPGGAAHPDAAPESNPRGLAVQFRLPDGSTTDLVSQSINGFPSRTVEEFAEFLFAIAPSSSDPGAYLAGHPAAAAFVQQIQNHGTPRSYATLNYFAINAFRFENAEGAKCSGRYSWEATEGLQILGPDEPLQLGDDYLGDELRRRVAEGDVHFSLTLSVAQAGEVTNDATLAWSSPQTTIELGKLSINSIAEVSMVTEQGLLFDPTRLVDGIVLSDDPLLVARSRTYAISSARRHGTT
jgi:catalase